MEAELNTDEGYIIVDQKSLAQKLKVFLKDGIDSLQIIADFDLTLTRARVNGKNASSTFWVLHEWEYVSEEYLKRGKELYEYYRHIEIDHEMPLEEKEQHMNIWWDLDLNGVVQEKLSKENFLTMTKTSNLNFRSGTKEFFDLKLKYQFPFLVVSAGIGEVIKAAYEIYFENNNIPVDSLKPFSIVSNLGVYDENNIIVDFQKPHITIMNKDVSVARFIDEQKHKDEEEHHHIHGNVIMMGDIVEDVKMLDKVNIDCSIKIGFLNNIEKLDDKLFFDNFCNHYDIIITNDGNLTLLNWLIKTIAEFEENSDYTTNIDVLDEVIQISKELILSE